MDIQTVGLKIAYFRRIINAKNEEINKLKTQIAVHKKRIEELMSENKATLEEIMCSPGANDYHSGRPHPMNDSIFKDENELWEHKKRS